MSIADAYHSMKGAASPRSKKLSKAAAPFIDTYTDAGTPQSYLAYNGGVTRPALLIWRRYQRDPFYERPPTIDEMRLILEYCAYFIHSPCLQMPLDILSVLRYEIIRITTCDELDRWLDGCAKIGLAPLGGL